MCWVGKRKEERDYRAGVNEAKKKKKETSLLELLQLVCARWVNNAASFYVGSFTAAPNEESKGKAAKEGNKTDKRDTISTRVFK